MLPVGQANRASSERASWIYVYWLSWIVGAGCISCYSLFRMSEIFCNGRKEGGQRRKGEMKENIDLDRPGLISLL